jgi:tRNA(fMet)-specific endonuclease VapC
MLTDTTFWIDLAQERARHQAGPAHHFLAHHRAHDIQVSVITWGELAVGVESPAELDRLLRRIRTLGIPLHVAWEAGRIQRELQFTGAILGENDLWIAATARAWGMRLVTRDRAFTRVSRLNVIAY